MDNTGASPFNNDAASIEASVWNALRRWVKSPSGMAFLSAVLIGLITHLYIYTNLYLAHDAVFLYNTYQNWEMQLGRFIGLPIKQILHNYLQLPFLIGILSLALIGMSSVFICAALKLKKPVYIVLTGAVIVTWPTITSTYCYMFTAVPYFMAMFAACLSAYIANRFRLVYLFGIPLIVVSMGCYQAYWGTAAMLMLLIIIGDILDGGAPASKIFYKALRFLITLGIGLGLYYGLWHIVLGANGLSFVTYLGIDEMGFRSLADLLKALKDTYFYVYAFFLRPNVYSYYPLYLFAVVLLGVALAALLGVRIIVLHKLYKEPAKCALLAAALALLPIAMNCATFFSRGASADSLVTRFAFLAPLLILIMLISHAADDKSILPNPKLKAAAFYMSAAVLLASCFNGFYGANATYVRQESGYHAAVSHVTQYLNRIQSEPGYTADTPVLIIGAPEAYERRGFGWTENVTGVTPNVLSREADVREYISLLGPSCRLLPDDPTPYLAAPAVRELDVFPSHNCVAWVDGVLVFKLSETA